MSRWMIVAMAACGHAGVDSRGAAAPAADPGQPARDAEIAARAAPFIDAFSNSAAVLAPDGQVAFVSTRAGLPQLYVADTAKPDAPPRKLPVPAERVLAPRLLPDGKTLVFLSDVGSDQKFHIFRIGLDGSGLADLTPAGELRRGAPQVARRARVMVYGAHVLDDQSTRVFVQRVDGPPREIYRDPKVGFVSDVTADGTRALYVQALLDTEQVLFAIDLVSGKPARLFGPRRPQNPRCPPGPRHHPPARGATASCSMPADARSRPRCTSTATPCAWTRARPTPARRRRRRRSSG